MLRRMFALVGVIVGCAGVGTFVFIAVKIWPVKAEVNRQTRYFATKAGAAGDAADHAIAFVRDIIGRAKADLGIMRLQPADPSDSSVNPLLRMTAIQASREVAGSVERAQGAVIAANDAVKVANEALIIADKYLDGTHAYPDLSHFLGVSPEHLQASRATLDSISYELRNARGILGVTPGSQVLTPEEVRAVNAALDKASELTDTVAGMVGNARQRIITVKNQVDTWARRIAWATSFLAVIGIVGQLFLLRYCVRKLLDLPA
ncbi:MAG TPA: hypothetical protein VLM40_15960 [Gemmata sp.]|nr:hypothetical protein [Gemmata sp.]